MSRKNLLLNFVSLLLLVMQTAYASVTVPVYSVSAGEENRNIGTILLADSSWGVLITPNLHHLPPGIHGFHIHEKLSCDDHGMAAGGHLDPEETKQHQGPYNTHGHLGDLPILVVNQDGTATLPTLAPRFKVQQIIGHTIIIHAGHDNYADTPEKLGGGGARIACGMIAKTPRSQF